MNLSPQQEFPNTIRGLLDYLDGCGAGVIRDCITDAISRRIESGDIHEIDTLTLDLLEDMQRWVHERAHEKDMAQRSFRAALSRTMASGEELIGRDPFGDPLLFVKAIYYQVSEGIRVNFPGAMRAIHD